MLYRAVALNLWRWGGDPSSEFEALRACHELGFDPDDPELRSEPVSRIASAVSAYAAVRAALLERQQDFAGQAGGAVLDGRDIGTVIAPDADVKLFVTAAPKSAPNGAWASCSRAACRRITTMCWPTSAPATSAIPIARSRRSSRRRMRSSSTRRDLDVDAAVAEAIRLVEERVAA